MISGLYSAASAMDVAAARHEVTAENLANVQMPGFRRRMIPQSTFDSMLQLTNQPSELYKSANLGTVAQPVQYNFTQGPLDETKRPLDVALSGDGFFTVNGPNGPLYTRNGSFHVTPERELVTIDRLPVMGTGGAITLPANATTENVHIGSDGRMYADGQEFGQLEVVRFNSPETLVAAGASLFSAPPTAGMQPANSEVIQGYRELANVSSVEEMVNLVANSRHYDAAQRALNTIAESIQKRIGLQ